MTDEQSNDVGSPFDRQLARIAVGAYDDAQDQRTAMMNRVRDVVRKRREDIPFDEVEDQKDEDDRTYDSVYDDDNLPALVEEMREDGSLTDEEFDYLDKMLEAGQAAARIENTYKDVMSITRAEPIYTEWLQHVYGVSTVLTARLIHTFGYCESSPKVSNLWSYSGLAPGQSPTRGEKLGYDPEAKTLAWLVADRIIMQGDRSRYKAEFYDPYKDEQVSRMEASRCVYCGKTTDAHYSPRGEGGRWCSSEQDQEVTLDDFEIVGHHAPDEASPPWDQGHADTRARRYLGKKVLKHYWALSRDIKGLPVPDEYVVTHGGHEKRTDTFENPFHAKRVLAAD